VVHGFAIGQSDAPAVDVLPGEVSQTWLEFDQPGTYTFYCTRWCGVNHWRMRGTIEVEGGEAGSAVPASPPLYQVLGIDLDQPHPAEARPTTPPDAQRGLALAGTLPRPIEFSLDDYRAQSPAAVRQKWRTDRSLAGLSDQDLWDLVAYTYTSTLSSAERNEAAQLYASNCAACHGERGDGQGVFAEALTQDGMAMGGTSDMGPATSPVRPANFTDAASMLGASPALLQGKILRGGMGTGMPMWGAILTDQQIWKLASFLYTFQFDKEPAS
jgi:mono/diheme cytochrome c family protein